MPLVQVKSKAQVTLPIALRKRLHIKEGDYLEAEIEHNKITLVPQILIEKFAPVTLSKKGKKMLNEALENVKRGRVKKFKNAEDLIRELNQ